MGGLRESTVVAPEEDFRTLEAEAARRDQPVAGVLREAIEEKAAAVRRARRPHVAVASSTDGQKAADLTAEPTAERPQ